MKLSRQFSPRMIPFVLLATALGMFLQAEAATAQVRGGTVAGINMKYLVDQHQRFQADLDRLKEQLRATTEALGAERQEIELMAKELQESGLRPGSPEFDGREEEIARKQAEWKIKAAKHRKQIQTRESELLQNVYLEIKTEVERYSTQHGIAVVVQFIPPQSTGVDASRQTIQTQLTHPIVHVNQQQDITGLILGALNRTPVARR